MATKTKTTSEETTSEETTSAPTTEVEDNIAPAADDSSDSSDSTAEETAQSLTDNDIDAVDAPANEEAAAPAESSVASDSNPMESAPPRSGAPQPELSDSLKAVAGMENLERKEVENGRTYEIIFIARAGDPEAVEATMQRVRTLIEDAQGAVDNVRISEMRRLAYPIDKENEGIYVVVNARFAQDLTTELDRLFKLEESVLRHMTLRQDD